MARWGWITTRRSTYNKVRIHHCDVCVNWKAIIPIDNGTFKFRQISYRITQLGKYLLSVVVVRIRNTSTYISITIWCVWYSHAPKSSHGIDTQYNNIYIKQITDQIYIRPNRTCMDECTKCILILYTNPPVAAFERITVYTIIILHRPDKYIHINIFVTQTNRHLHSTTTHWITHTFKLKLNKFITTERSMSI